MEIKVVDESETWWKLELAHIVAALWTYYVSLSDLLYREKLEIKCDAVLWAASGLDLVHGRRHF